MSVTTITFIQYDNCDEEIVHKLPANYAICGKCEGKGTSTAHIEADGGGITADEMEELGDEFREDYLSGVYDRPCYKCSGSGKVKVLARSEVKPDLLKLYDEDQMEEASYRQMCEMERRMGA